MSSANSSKKKSGHNHFSQKPKKSSIKIFLSIFFAVIIVISIIIIAGHIYFSDKWYIDTVLNGTDVAGMKLENTISAFEKVYDNYSLTIKGRDDMSITVLKNDIDLSVKSDDCIKEAFDKQHEKFYLFALFELQNIKAAPVIEYSEEKFQNLLDNSIFVIGSEDKPIVAPIDARCEFSNDKGIFVVRPEIEGNTLNKEVFDNISREALEILVNEIDISDFEAFPNMYVKPQIKSEGSGLKEKCDAYNSTVIHWFNWNMADGHTVSITPQDVMAWYDIDDKYNITLNEQRVKDWTEQFCLKYKTVGSTRDFKTHKGDVIKVSGGDYGWQMSYNATLNQILDVLNADNSDKMKAYVSEVNEDNKNALTNNLKTIYLRKGINFGDAKDYPDTYSEVSIAEQKVYVYKSGELVYTANCITGKPVPERETTKGCWYVKEKLRNKTLVGEDYETPVSYWVRITWSGIGYHDAIWQNWQGWNPTRYQSVGSHGCINLSITDVEKIYELVNVGDPVFVY